MRTAWSTDEWGESCGARPAGGSEVGGTVSIAVRGGELTIVGLSRSWSTTQCWEQLPNMVVSSHAGGTRAWRTICRSAANDSRRATLTTSLVATDNRIDFEEAGTYELVSTDQTCRTNVRRSRTFTLVEREGEPRPAEVAAGQPAEPGASRPAEPPAASVAAPVPPPSDLIATGPLTEPAGKTRSGDQLRSCAVPGPAARIEVRPSRKLLRSGEKFTFRARVLDAGGCSLGLSPTWRLVETTTKIDVGAGGLVTVPADATEGEARISASVEGRTVPVTVTVVSEARYRELLSDGSFTDAGETREAAIATLAGSAMGTGAAVAENTARKKRTLFIWVVVGLSGLLGIAAVVMARQRKRPVVGEPPTLTRSAPPASRLLCPSCGGSYPGSELFCPRDGESLVPQTPSSAPPSAPSLTAAKGTQAIAPTGPGAGSGGRKICPLCGTTYEGESGFCGNDGAALVPLN
jgi:hypothetical protein